ncbi:MAG: hypothetical protein K2K46_07875 [Lachnospiraceae bacterium]|nr:hypothetical protein [Lachnospiraceae bacterium]
MRTNISISKRIVFNIIIFVIGSVLLLGGVKSYYKYKHAIPIRNLNEWDCKEGKYVSGSIDEYIGQKLEVGNKSIFMGSCTTLLTLTGKAYEFYTVPIAQDSYIRIMLSDKSILDKLKNFSEGKGEGIYFIGEIKASPIEAPIKWYDRIEGFSSADVVKSYVIREINIKSKKDLTYIGLLLVIFSVLLFYSSGGINNIVTKENDTDGIKPKSNNYANSYNKSNELLLEKNKLQLFEKRLSELKKKCFIGFVLLGLGIYIVVGFHFLEIKLIGILLILYSIKCICRYFINSGSESALWLVRKFGLESVSVKIEECKINVWEIERLLEKEEEAFRNRENS